MDVFRIQEIHLSAWSTTNCCTGRGLRRQRVGAEALEATIQHHVTVKVLQRREAVLGHIRGSVLCLNALDGLKGLQVVTVGNVISDDQSPGSHGHGPGSPRAHPSDLKWTKH